MNKLKELMKKFGEMKKAHKIAVIISAILLVVVLVTSIVLLVNCGGGNGSHGSQNSGSDDSNATKETYTVSVKTAGGMVMSELDIYIYADEKLTDLKDFKSTDENGLVNFNLAQGGDYYIVVSGAPKGYDVAKSYKFSGNTAVITLTSAIVTGQDAPASLGVGDVMYDMTVTTPDGTKYTLSEILKEKDMIMLNFWYTSCTYCVEEFPYIEEAYQQYKDSIEILALNPLGEGNNAIQNFKDSYQLSFPMAECATNWSSVFGIQGYPTTIMIDRYGVICMMESGGVPSLRPFISAFEHFTGDDYEQKLCANGISDLVTQIKPTYTMDSSEDIGAAINKGDITVTYRAEEGESGEYSWPFIITDYNGEKVIKASNQQIDDSYAILYADIELKAGQAIGFDYIISSELTNDALYVIVNNEDIYQMSGYDENPTWKSCYPCVALEDGTYELALVYMKDSSTNDGDDTVYIKNMRVVSESEIDSETYLPREAATSKDGFEFEYVDIVYNEKDGYYHVGSANGPLLLANLMDATQFSEEQTIHDLCYSGDIVMEDGTSIYEYIVDYCSYATNTRFGTVCTVNKELADLLKIVADQAGFDDEDDNEWLKICMYYQAYGTNGKQLEDPIKGLSIDSAYTATLGKNVSTNYFYYNRAIIPRGMFAAFTPSKSGVYRITSRTDTDSSVDGWIFNENKEELLVYEHDERMYEDDHNVSMVYYMEAGKTYYINIAFWDLYEVGYIYYDIEYVAASVDLFRLCSPGYFTYDAGATGEDMYYVIAGGIDVILKDGKYYEDLGKDANGNQLYGSLIYCDFSGTTGIFSDSLSGGVLEMGGFDFTKTEDDLIALSYLNKFDGDVDKTVEYLKEYWGDDYDSYYEEYQMDDIFAGRYHGTGEDYTEEVRAYISQMDKSNTEKQGCVVVTERLAELLQMLMDKYTFEDVENSWVKLCYYYDYIGAAK